MILDGQNIYSDAQAVTASAGSTNQIDHGPLATGNLGRDLGTGQPLYLVVAVVTAFTDAGSDSTVTATLETDADSAFGSPVTALSLAVFAALSAAGTTRIAHLPPKSPGVDERYSRVFYTVANGNLTTGAFDAFLVENIQQFTAYADSVTIS